MHLTSQPELFQNNKNSNSNLVTSSRKSNNLQLSGLPVAELQGFQVNLQRYDRDSKTWVYFAEPTTTTYLKVCDFGIFS